MARPLGSTNGRRPPVGYPDVAPELAGFLAGFLEGEACFSINKQSTHDNHKCAMTLVARDDDQNFILWLADSTALGRCTTRPGRAGSNAQIVWNVGAKSDCQRLIEILALCPLRGRKSLDYAIWKAAAEWWIGTDPTFRKTGQDWTPMVYLKARLSEARRYSRLEAKRQIVDIGDGLDPDWGSYTAGYFTAEGCFGIYSSNGLKPKAQLRVRRDDRPLLAAICRRIGAGRLYLTDDPTSRNSPSVSWVVASRDDLSRLVEVFDQHPPRGRKLREYEVWRAAVIEYARGKSPAERLARLTELRGMLSDARAHRPRTP
jgi:hypothetical protein